MSKRAKLLEKLANHQSDTNWTLDEAMQVLGYLGFAQTGGKGSHRVFTRPGYAAAITLAAHGNSIKTGYIREIREHSQIIQNIEEK